VGSARMPARGISWILLLRPSQPLF
jgi:hypothetical protein